MIYYDIMSAFLDDIREYRLSTKNNLTEQCKAVAYLAPLQVLVKEYEIFPRWNTRLISPGFSLGDRPQFIEEIINDLDGFYNQIRGEVFTSVFGTFHAGGAPLSFFYNDYRHWVILSGLSCEYAETILESNQGSERNSRIMLSHLYNQKMQTLFIGAVLNGYRHPPQTI